MIEYQRTPVVSLIGRPNVGKSTLFNRLMKKNFKAMAFDQPGVTRDRHYDVCTLDGNGDEARDLILIDTGGFYPERVEMQTGRQKAPAEPFFELMADQASLAVAESDLVLFIVDVREGLLPMDIEIAKILRATQKPVWVMINKFDSEKQMGDENEFYSLGIETDEYLVLSSEHNRGVEVLKEKLFNFAKNFNPMSDVEVQRGVRPNFPVVGSLAIIGAPNAGKSTLLNQLVGAHRALVSDVAGTTVDPIEAHFDINLGDEAHFFQEQDHKFKKSDESIFDEIFADYQKLMEENPDAEDFSDLPEEEAEEEVYQDKHEGKRSLKIVDTAGIRKRSKVDGFIEEQSVYRSLKAITSSDIVILLVDATKGITHQDRRLCDIALDKGKSLLICLNKVDLIQDTMRDPYKKKEWMKDLRYDIPWLSFCELITISAMKGQYLSHLKRALVQTLKVRLKKISTSQINKTFNALVDRNPIVLNKSRGNYFKIKYASMVKNSPPTFLLFTNKSKEIPANFRKYLVNGVRREFNLVNTPIHLVFRTGGDIERKMRKRALESNT